MELDQLSAVGLKSTWLEMNEAASSCVSQNSLECESNPQEWQWAASQFHQRSDTSRPSSEFTPRATDDVVLINEHRWCRLKLSVSLSVSQHLSKTAKTQYVVNYSRPISFFSLCLTQWHVGDCGQPVRVRRQDQQTEASKVKARRSEWMDLPGLYGRRSLSGSKSLWYSMRNDLIRTVSSISSGSIYSCNITRTLLIVQLMHVSLYKNIITHLHFTSCALFC